MGEHTKELMDISIDYQNRATLLQTDINQQISLIRQTVTELLRLNMNETIYLTDANSDRVLETYKTMNELINKLEPDDCLEELVKVSEIIIRLIGFGISNILTDHDQNVTVALGDADNTIKKFDLIATSVQRVVHKAYFKSNIFKEPQLVSQKFIKDFERFKTDWEVIRPEISNVILNMRNSFSRTLRTLETKFNALQNSLDDSFNSFESNGVQICIDYSGLKSFKLFAKKKVPYFNHDHFLPKIDVIQYSNL